MSQRSRKTAFPFKLFTLPRLVVALTVVGACEMEEPPTDPAVQTDQQRRADHNDIRDLGRALPDLSRQERRLFDRGQAVFLRVFTEETGLGPLFNANGCVTCHGIPAVGGVGPQIETHATLFLGGAGDTCDEQDETNGGSVVQDSVTTVARGAGVVNEAPPVGTDVGRRITPDLFGFGLLEAVADEEILKRADPDDRNRDGISGRASISDGEVGRFGRKGQVPDLLDFIADAFIYEQGITNPPDEAEEQTLAQFPGVPLPDGADPAPDPEVTEEEVAAAAAFVRFLAPPEPARLGRLEERGRRIFSEIGCVSCHVPALRTGPNPVRALSRKVVHAYTDLLIHDMGEALADLCKGEAGRSEFRTEPLMGTRFAIAFMHDGRATTVEEAIRLHAGEAEHARNRFARLSPQERSALLSFVNSL